MLLTVSEKGLSIGRGGEDSSEISAISALQVLGGSFSPQEAASVVSEALNLTQSRAENLVQSLYDRDYLVDLPEGSQEVTPYTSQSPISMPVPGETIPSVIPGSKGSVDSLAFKYRSLLFPGVM